MVRKYKSIFGIFKTRNAVQAAIDELGDNGFVPSEISILFPENASPQDLTHLNPNTEPSLNSSIPIDRHLDIMDGARSIIVAGFKPLIAAGPAMKFLHEVGSIELDGWLSGPLISMGLSISSAQHSEVMVKAGSFLLAVQCITEECEKTAQLLFHRHGAIDISLSLEQSHSDEEWETPPQGGFFQTDLATTIVNT